MMMLISGTNINSARNGLKPAFLKINQYGMMTTIEMTTAEEAKKQQEKQRMHGGRIHRIRKQGLTLHSKVLPSLPPIQLKARTDEGKRST